jgi:hypothetical protein
VVVVSDPYSLLEWKDIVLEIAASNSATPLHVLVDGRYCSPPTSDFVVRALSILQTQEHMLTGGRVAVVVSTDASYGMGRLAEAAADVRQLSFAVRTFRAWPDAEQWLASSKASGEEEIKESAEARLD